MYGLHRPRRNLLLPESPLNQQSGSHHRSPSWDRRSNFSDHRSCSKDRHSPPNRRSSSSDRRSGSTARRSSSRHRPSTPAYGQDRPFQPHRRPCNRSPSRHDGMSSICSYHQRFGRVAHNCTPPCSNQQGKLDRQTSPAATVCTPISGRPFVTDRFTKRRFLIDTCCDLCFPMITCSPTTIRRQLRPLRC
jgi:hypothetical protein